MLLAGNSNFSRSKYIPCEKARLWKKNARLQMISPHCLCTLGAGSLCSYCNWAERCVSSVKWWRDIEKCYCTIVAKTTHFRHQKGRLTTIILQPYIFVRASVNGLLLTREDPFLCIEFQRLWNYKLLRLTVYIKRNHFWNPWSFNRKTELRYWGAIKPCLMTVLVLSF